MARQMFGCLALLARDAVEFVSVAFRQELFGGFTDRGDRFAGRIAAGVRTVDGDRVVEVEAVEHLSAVGLRQRGELAYGSHLAAVRAHEDVVERLGVETVLRIGLDDDAVNLREAVEVRHVLSAVLQLFQNRI